jgi:protein-tyrosine phosphatase
MGIILQNSKNNFDVLFVCLGNICRSPAAEAIARHYHQGFPILGLIDSAGTSAFHVGEPPHKIMQEVATQRGISMKNQYSRQVSVQDFYDFSFILAMDSQNLSDLKKIKPADSKAQLTTLLEFSDGYGGDVPDPYYGGKAGFIACFEIIEQGVQGFLEHIKNFKV